MFNILSFDDFALLEHFDYLINSINEAAPKEFWIRPSQNDIIQAIDNRWHVGIYYEEEENSNIKSGFRLIEPFVYGKGYIGKTGIASHKTDDYIRAFVIKDTTKDPNTKFKTRQKSVSKSKWKPYWRLFRVDRIKRWDPIKRKIIKLRPYYNPDDKNIMDIIAFIPPNKLRA